MDTETGWRILLLVMSLLMSAFCSETVAESDYTLDTLRCEYRTNPLGIDIAAPRLSWTAASSVRGRRQTAFQILVASSPEKLTPQDADVWNSEKVASDRSAHIAYAGTPLVSETAYYWTVRCWDKDGAPSPWSQTAEWTTGLLSPADWTAQWIGSDVPLREGLPIFRKVFRVEKPIRRAIVSVCGMGHYELFLNGQKIGDRFLDPAWSTAEKTVYYTTYDITTLLKDGGNVFGIMLGKGFYNTEGDRRIHGVKTNRPLTLILQARLIYDDGSGERVVSNADWKTAPGPILHDAILGGTDYDARRLPSGWLSAEFDDGEWRPARQMQGPSGLLRASESPPMQVLETFKPVRIDQPEPGIFVYDFGQNASAKPQLRITGKAGQTVRLMPAEQRHGQTGRANDGAGRVNQAGVGQPNYWQYTLARDSQETWSPAFNYSGFQYIEVTGAVPAGTDDPNGLPVIDELLSLHVRNASPPAGVFECSEPLFNDIYRLVDWAVRSNMAHVLTDCPHREKLGWLEVSYLMGPSIAYGYDIASLQSKIARDIRDAQDDDGTIYTVAPNYPAFDGGFRYTPEWGAAGVLVPWLLYQWYGESQALEDNFQMMRRFVDLMHKTADGLIPRPGLGDWYDYGHGRNPGASQFTPPELTATAIFYHCTDVVAQAAAVLGRTQDAAEYAALAGKIKEAFNERFFNGTDEYKNNGSCQTANGMALALGLVATEHRPSVLQKLAEELRLRNHQQTSGDIGFRYLLEALLDGGQSDIIAAMTRRETLGSYGGIVKQGWTSMPEAWDVNLNSSLNHCMLGHIQQWFWQGLAGIRPDPEGPGFKRIIINPQTVGTLTAARGAYRSMYGMIESDWRKTEHTMTLNVVIPANTTARIHLPTTDAAKVKESEQPLSEAAGLRVLQNAPNGVVVAVGSGRYAFTVDLRP